MNVRSCLWKWYQNIFPKQNKNICIGSILCKHRFYIKSHLIKNLCLQLEKWKMWKTFCFHVWVSFSRSSTCFFNSIYSITLGWLSPNCPSRSCMNNVNDSCNDVYTQQNMQIPMHTYMREKHFGELQLIFQNHMKF